MNYRILNTTLNVYSAEIYWIYYKRDSIALKQIVKREAGHAYVSLCNDDAPAYITIVSRSNHGGYMQHGDNESRRIYTKDELLARIRTALAGRTTKVVYYGENDGISTGASGDSQTATSIANHLIYSYGIVMISAWLIMKS